MDAEMDFNVERGLTTDVEGLSNGADRGLILSWQLKSWSVERCCLIVKLLHPAERLRQFMGLMS
jgi:hypothetical protein